VEPQAASKKIQKSADASNVVPLRPQPKSEGISRKVGSWKLGSWELVEAKVEAEGERLAREAAEARALDAEDRALCAEVVAERRVQAEIAGIRKLQATSFPAPAADAPAGGYTTTALLDDYAKARKARGRATATLAIYAAQSKTLRRLLPERTAEITHARLLGYIETRRAEGAGEVVRKELHGLLRPALKLAYKSGLFDADPAKVIPELDSLAKPRERWLTADEAWKVVRWLDARSKAGRDHAACIAFAVATGAEYAAWSRAKRADVREDRKGARVHGTKRATRDRFAPAPLPEQHELLRFALDNAAGSGCALFTGWSVTNANSDLREACDAIGIPRCSTNDLRRSYASWLGQAGVRDELIEKAMGHKGASVLGRHYRKLTDEDLLRLMEADLQKEAADLRTRAADLGSGEVGRAGLEPATYGLKVRSSTD
jgi:integrase